MRKRVIENKRGLSAVVTNLIIILLVIVAVGIVWVVFQNLAGDVKSGINLDKIRVGMEIKNVQVDGNNVSVQVHRKKGEGNVSGLKFMVYDSNGNSQSFEKSATNFGELATQTFTLENYTRTNVAKVEVAPIIVLNNGKSEVGKVLDTYNPSDYEDIVVCEEGDPNQVTNITSCDGSDVIWTFTNKSCVNGEWSTVDTSTGINETCSGGTVCSGGQCVAEDAVCGDGTRQIGEDCDGSDLNSETCTSLKGSGYTGTLTCTDTCEFNYSQCVESSTPTTPTYDNISSSNCNQLNWGAPGGNADCGESDASPIGQCYTDVNWTQARDICENAGARLCTKFDLENRAAVNTGCGFDLYMIWTNTECGNGGFYLVQSDNVHGTMNYCEEDLTTTTPEQYYSSTYNQIGVRCCGDGLEGWEY